MYCYQIHRVTSRIFRNTFHLHYLLYVICHFLGLLPSQDLLNDQKHLEEEDEKTRKMKEKEEQLRKQEVLYTIKVILVQLVCKLQFDWSMH
jgi:hypothetical protein